MKKIIVVTMAILAGVGLSGLSHSATGIANSPHDLRATVDTVRVGEICIACHTPHNAIVSGDAPLWNHTLSGATYTTYVSGTLDATVGAPDGVSKLCLSCHDGTVALDAFGDDAVGTESTKLTAATGGLGTNLKMTHPFSFTYPTTDTELETLATIQAKGWLNGTANDQFECSSCHDVHNKTVHSSMLNASNDNSALCLTCHKK